MPQLRVCVRCADRNVCVVVPCEQGREKAKQVKEQQRAADMEVVREAMMSVDEEQARLAAADAEANMPDAVDSFTMATLEAGLKMGKKSKRFGWLPGGLGLQSKELKLEDTALVYTKGKSKVKRLPYASIEDVAALPAAKGATAWALRMSDGSFLEFHAQTAEARETWIKAIGQRVAAARSVQQKPVAATSAAPKPSVGFAAPPPAPAPAALAAKEDTKSKLKSKQSFARGPRGKKAA